LSVLPNGELKNEITAAMNAYVDAIVLFQSKINGDDWKYADEEPVATWVTKYSLGAFLHELASKERKIIEPESSMQKIWGIADAQLDRASSLIR
jgi:hypothetical protein